MQGLISHDRKCYHLGFMLFYACAKYKLILGNPLSYLHKLCMDHSVDNQKFISGVTFEPDFGYPSGCTTALTDKLYHKLTEKHPLIKEFHRRADLNFKGAQIAKTTTLEKQHETMLEILQLPSVTLFGFRFPGVVEKERFER